MRDCGFFSDKENDEVLKIMNVGEQALKRDIEILKEWLQKQLHLPQGIHDDFFFQNILIRNKCRVEKAKACIDSYYTSRTLWPEMYQNIKDIVPSRHNVRCIPLRTLGKQKERIILNVTVNPDASMFHFQDMCDILIANWELQLKYDCSTATRIVFDFQNFNAEMVTRVPPATLVRLEKLFRPIKLDWWPVTRDVIIYILSVLILVAMTWDGKVYWYEGLVLFIVYFIYFTIMFQNRRISAFVKKHFVKNNKVDDISKINNNRTSIASVYGSYMEEPITVPNPTAEELKKMEAEQKPVEQDDFFFENMLIRNKCRVEKAKACIDSYYTCKNIWPDMFEDVKNIVPSNLSIRVIPLHSLGSQKERYVFCEAASPDASLYKVKDFTNMLLAIAELALRYDYNNGIRIIVDFRNHNAEMLAKVPPILVSKAERIFRECYAGRIVGMEFYRPRGVLISLLLKLVKAIFPKKIFERVVIHDDFESLIKVVPKEALPREYGGKEKSVPELLAEQDEIFKVNRKLFEDMTLVKSDEKLRIGKCSYDTEVYGTEGSFKQLNLD